MLFSKTLEDVKYNNLNCVQTVDRARTGGPFIHGSIPTLSNVPAAHEYDAEGPTTASQARSNRPFSNGWFASGSYLYGDAHTIQDGTNSTALLDLGQCLHDQHERSAARPDRTSRWVIESR